VFYSPEEAFRRLRKAAERFGTQKARISGAEPTIGREHLVELLELVEGSGFELFVLETNGILFGVDRGYVEEVSKFSKVHVRVSLKGGTAEDFARKTGGRPEAFELPFRGIRNLLECGASFHVAAMSLDPRITTRGEREALLAKLLQIDPRLAGSLEEEVVDPYRTALIRLKKAGMELEWPLKGVYKPARSVLGS